MVLMPPALSEPIEVYKSQHPGMSTKTACAGPAFQALLDSLDAAEEALPPPYIVKGRKKMEVSVYQQLTKMNKSAEEKERLKKKRREHDRDEYNGRTEEQKEKKRNEYNGRTEEQKEKKRKKVRDKYNGRTEEQKEKKKEKERDEYANLPEEQKEKKREKARDKYNGRTEEQKEKKKEKDRDKYNGRTEEEKEERTTKRLLNREENAALLTDDKFVEIRPASAVKLIQGDLLVSLKQHLGAVKVGGKGEKVCAYIGNFKMNRFKLDGLEVDEATGRVTHLPRDFGLFEAMLWRSRAECTLTNPEGLHMSVGDVRDLFRDGLIKIHFVTDPSDIVNNALERDSQIHLVKEYSYIQPLFSVIGVGGCTPKGAQQWPKEGFGTALVEVRVPVGEGWNVGSKKVTSAMTSDERSNAVVLARQLLLPTLLSPMIVDSVAASETRVMIRCFKSNVSFYIASFDGAAVTAMYGGLREGCKVTTCIWDFKGAAIGVKKFNFLVKPRLFPSDSRMRKRGTYTLADPAEKKRILQHIADTGEVGVGKDEYDIGEEEEERELVLEEMEEEEEVGGEAAGEEVAGEKPPAKKAKK
ncbi:hypothetical protein TeGR_g2668, partial [Tetraparma gracilis]